MDQYLAVLALGALPALGNFGGGLVVEFIDVSERTLSIALHLAAGIVLGVVAVELLPEAFAVEQPWLVILAFLGGGVAFVLLDSAIELVQRRVTGSTDGGAWAIFLGVSIELFSDGVMIGAGTTISFGLALLLALGQLPANAPEGFATMANFKARGMPRRQRLLVATAFLIPMFAGATLGYWGVRDAPEAAKLMLLAFTAGILTTVAVEKMIPQAHQRGGARVATGAFVGGFALFALLSEYLG